MSFDQYAKQRVFGGPYTFETEGIPFSATIPAGRAVNLTIPGTPPYMVYSTLYDAKRQTKSENWEHPPLPGNLTTNQFMWTPQLESSGQDGSVTNGNEPKFESGDSVIWVFAEMKGNWTSQTVFNDSYATGNFTVLTEEEYEKQDSEGQPNGSAVRRASLTGIALAAILCISVLTV